MSLNNGSRTSVLLASESMIHKIPIEIFPCYPYDTEQKHGPHKGYKQTSQVSCFFWSNLFHSSRRHSRHRTLVGCQASEFGNRFCNSVKSKTSFGTSQMLPILVSLMCNVQIGLITAQRVQHVGGRPLER